MPQAINYPQLEPEEVSPALRGLCCEGAAAQGAQHEAGFKETPQPHAVSLGGIGIGSALPRHRLSQKRQGEAQPDATKAKISPNDFVITERPVNCICRHCQARRRSELW